MRTRRLHANLTDLLLKSLITYAIWCRISCKTTERLQVEFLIFINACFIITNVYTQIDIQTLH